MSTTKFVLTQGSTNEYYITIKQDDSTLPMVIDPTDTFTLNLYLLSTGAKVLELDMTTGTNGQISIYDADNGKLKIVFNQVAVDALLVERGDRADYYYSKPLYRLAIEASTVNNGDFVATIDKVYVQ